LLLILVIAALFRLPFLASNPVGFHADEASTGYDAYSIWETGRDQHGVYFPLFARSFGEYNEALHRYLVAPFVGVLGLNEFAVRLPNALLGILTVWVLYHLVLKLWGQVPVACLAGLFLAISPWHVQFSRWGARAILLPLFFCLALLLFQKGRVRPLYWIFSALIFGLALYSYSSARVFVPLFLIGLAWLYWHDLKRWKVGTLISGCIFLAILVGLFQFWVTPEGMSRARELVNLDPIVFAYSYATYFFPKFLFFHGDPNLRHSLLGMGQLYHFELVLVPLGFWRLWQRKRAENKVLWLWLALYPIPAAFTGEPHAIRSLIGAPLFAIFSGWGFYVLWEWSKKKYRTVAKGVVLVGVFNVLLYLKLFYVDYPKYSGWWWEYGMKEVIAYAEERPHLCVLHTHGFYTPFYIHALFFSQYPPEEYQKLPAELKEKNWAFLNLPFNDKYLNLDVQDLSFDDGGVALLVMHPEDVGILDEVAYKWREVHRIYDLSGVEVIRIIEAGKGM
ncbi:MAG: glycosyltransferase family 39 protein, partial [Candidatus Latescibacteria bacterium]|nr:glycosyltransferase family 39 protein [Candidatus Latescibacterota bacterium]